MQLTEKEKQLVSKSKQFYTEKKAWIVSTAFYAFVTANDWISSMLSRNMKDVEEQNPFARDVNMHFVLHKAAVIDAIFFTALCLVSYAVYNALREWNKQVAKAASCSLFIYIAYDRLINAVVPNYLLALHFFVPSKESAVDLLRKLFGG